MSWLKGFIEGIRGTEATDWTLVDNLPDPNLDLAGKPIEPDQCYVELFIESLRLKQARRFGTRFNGLVYSFVTLSHEGGDDAELAAVSKPDNLANLDGSNLDRVITVSNRMMGAVPWRGGRFGLELGLFSVKVGNLLSPLLDYVTKVSEAGGASFIGQVKPFLPLITDGMDLIAGQVADSLIEVAVDTDMHLTESRLCAIVAVPKGSLDVSRLSLDPQDRKLLLEGRPLEEAYCVFSIRRTDQKADFGAIPEIKSAWADMRAAILSNDKSRAEAALSTFNRTVLVSPDLIPSDSARLIAKAKQQVRAAFATTKGLAPVSRRSAQRDIGALEDVSLYD